MELALQPWDYAAGLLLVEEAGGWVTTPDGAPLSLLEGSGVLASNGQLHTALIDVLNEQEKYQWNCALQSRPES